MDALKKIKPRKIRFCSGGLVEYAMHTGNEQIIASAKACDNAIIT